MGAGEGSCSRPARSSSARSRARWRLATRTRPRWRCSIRGRGNGLRGPRGARRLRIDAARGRGRDRADLDDHRRVRRVHGSGSIDAGRRGVRGRDGGHARLLGSSSRARSATWSARRSRCAPRPAGPARTRRCSSSAIRTPTPMPGCSRTPVRLAATCGGGGTSRADRARRRGRGTGRCVRPPVEGGRTHPARRRGSRVPSCRACRARWPPNGTRSPRPLRADARALARPHDVAILGGSAFTLRDIVEAMANAGLNVRRSRSSARREGSDLAPIKADVTGLPVRVPTSVETTATGAAILAAVGGPPPDGGRCGEGVRRIRAGRAPTRPGATRDVQRVLPPVPRPLRGPQAGVRRVSSVRLTTR